MLIIVDLNMFTLTSTVSVNNGNNIIQEQVDNALLVDYTLALANNSKDKVKICINGLNDYANNIKTQMENELNTKYSNNNIEIEVIQ